MPHLAPPVQVEPAMMIERQQSPAQSRAIALVPLAARISTIREVLASLDTLTIAGRQHAMGRVAAFIEGQITQAAQRVGGGNRRTLADQVDLLKHEAGRQMPSVTAFRQRASNLLDLLRAGE
jgi:hypothetical protein